MAKLIQVIEAERVTGRGVVRDPLRKVTEYWSPDGDLIATRDPEVDGMITSLLQLVDKLSRNDIVTDLNTVFDEIVRLQRAAHDQGAF